MTNEEIKRECLDFAERMPWVKTEREMRYIKIAHEAGAKWMRGHCIIPREVGLQNQRYKEALISIRNENKRHNKDCACHYCQACSVLDDKEEQLTMIGE